MYHVPWQIIIKVILTVNNSSEISQLKGPHTSVMGSGLHSSPASLDPLTYECTKALGAGRKKVGPATVTSIV